MTSTSHRTSQPVIQPTSQPVIQPRHRRLNVAEVVTETPDACSVVFESPGPEAGWFRHRPGQFVTIRVPHPDGDVARCYSLSSAPDDDRPAITIKRAGPASAWLCDNVAAGWVLDVLPPSGRFTPPSMDQDLLLIAAGSGITPIMSIVRAVMALGSAHLTLVYANRDPGSVIFARQLQLLATRHTGRLRLIPWLESDAGLPTSAGLAPLLQPYADRETYLCGPEPFMAQVLAALTSLGVPRRQVHRERFISLADDPFALAASAGETSGGELPGGELPGGGEPSGSEPPGDGEPAAGPSAPGSDPAAAAGHEPVSNRSPTAEVTLDGTLHRLAWPGQVTLLELLSRSGLAAPSSCRSGQCGACATRVQEGQVRMAANDVLDQDDLAEGYILACQALPVSDLIRITYD